MWVSLRAVETEDGWERKVKILGPAESGNAGEMRVAFVDGTVDDWDVDEFVAHKEPPKDLIKSQVGACLFLRATAPALHCTALHHYCTTQRTPVNSSPSSVISSAALCVTRFHSADCRGAANAAVAYS